MEKLLIRNVRIYDPSQNLNGVLGNLLLEGGRILEAGAGVEDPQALVLEGNGLCAAPGLVDLHVHLRDPGYTYKEDIFTGCRAAAAGGVTSLVCMPNTSPALDSPQTIAYVLEQGEKADARVYPAAAITKGLEDNGGLCDLEELARAGAAAFSNDGRPVVNSAEMAEAMERAAALHKPVLSHCEDLYLSQGGKMHQGSVSRELGVPGVPAAAEECCTAREIALAAAYHVPVHICHVSTAGSVAMIRDARRRGVKVTGETAPHYFALTHEELRARDGDFRMSPPLRETEDVQAIIQGLKDGTLQAIATDHAPHSPEEKEDFLKAPNGSIGMETSLAAAITYLVKPGHLSLLDVIRLMSTSPAGILGIPAGTLAPGAPADVVLFDPEEAWTVCPEQLHGKSRNAVFKGRTLFGKVKYTLCRGKIVFKDASGEA